MTCSRKLQKRLEVALRASLHTSSSQRQIAKQLGVSRSFLQRWHRRFKQEGSVSDRVGRGRKPALDSADVAHAVQLALAKPLGGSVEVAAQLKAKSGKAVAPSTIRRHLRAAGLVNGYARKVPFLTDKHKAARLGFCTRNSQDPMGLCHVQRQQDISAAAAAMQPRSAGVVLEMRQANVGSHEEEGCTSTSASPSGALPPQSLSQEPAPRCTPMWTPSPASSRRGAVLASTLIESCLR